jgi:hypothetical protein
MSQPEISRRCLSCGASVRAGARFCPQCGAAVKDGAHATPAANQTADATAAAGREAAPSRREVVSAFETWKEDARPSPPAGVEGPEKRERGTDTDSAARPSVGESPPVRSEAARQETRGGASVTAPSAPAALREEVDEGVGDSNVAAAAGQGPGVEAARRRRAGAVVKENIMPRVERMREEALVVLEETPDDAGLRFVAAAVVLFLLFLLFFFLSTALK